MLRMTSILLLVSLTFSLISSGFPNPEGEYIEYEDSSYSIKYFLIGFTAVAAGCMLTTLIVNALSNPDELEFVEEDVSINLLKDDVSVSGIYTFKNTTDKFKIAGISYPFFIENEGEEPRSISIVNDEGEEIEYYRSSDSVKFFITLSPDETQDIHIRFTQSINDSDFTYILSSTQSWNKPLNKASFTINTDSEIERLNFSYPFELTSLDNGKNSYIFTANNFYPKDELELSWE